MSINREKALETLHTLYEALGASEGQSLEEIKADLRDDLIAADAALDYLLKAQEKISLEAKEKWS